jgi:hypothetical protein
MILTALQQEMGLDLLSQRPHNRAQAQHKPGFVCKPSQLVVSFRFVRLEESIDLAHTFSG